MTDDVFLFNVYRSFVAIRMDIRFLASIELLQLIQRNFNNSRLNSHFIDDCNKSETLWQTEWEYLSLSNEVSTAIDIEKNFVVLFSRVLSEIIRLLHDKNFDYAYDIIDMFHCLPESLARREKVNIVNFIFTRGEYLGEKWGTAFVDELYSMLSINWFSRKWLRLKIMRSRINHSASKSV